MFAITLGALKVISVTKQGVELKTCMAPVGRSARVNAL